MKKFLSILASLTIITSSATGVIACGTTSESKKDKTETVAENTNKANLLGAAFNEAKAIILDNEYKLSQKISNKAINTLAADNFIDDYTPEGSLTTDSTVKDVINQYFGPADNYTKGYEDKTVSLNNTKGEISGLEAFIRSKTSKPEIINSISGAIVVIKSLPEYDGLKTTGILDILNTIYQNQPQDNEIVKFIFNFLASSGIKDIAEPTHKFLSQFSPYVEAYFGKHNKDKRITHLREFTKNYLQADSPKKLQEDLYAQEDSAHKIPKIADIKVADAKTEFFRAIQRLLENLFVFPEHHDDLFKEIDHDSLDGVSLTFADFISAMINKKPLKKKEN